MRTIEIISYSVDEICVSTGKGLSCVEMAWNEIEEVIAFKRDLITTDLICLELRSSQGGAIVVHEEMNGWEEFCGALSRHLDGMPVYEKWWHSIAIPAFETNTTVLWRR
jgi:hypothetical protein